jgi:uncharacterized protein YjbI with pentapeptide repeats
VYEEQDALLAIPRWELDPELQKKIDLSDVDLRKANLELAWLKRADLSGAHLEGSNLTDAHLERAVAHGARFDGADMRGAHLQWASVPLATFRETQLGGADLRHAQGITQEQINEALGDANTRLPPDLHRPPSWL